MLRIAYSTASLRANYNAATASLSNPCCFTAFTHVNRKTSHSQALTNDPKIMSNMHSATFIALFY
jgi:hypothetical protein